MKIIVTGGAGFIGSAVCRLLVGGTIGETIGDAGHSVVNVDALTYAANLASEEPVAGNPRYRTASVMAARLLVGPAHCRIPQPCLGPIRLAGCCALAAVAQRCRSARSE